MAYEVNGCNDRCGCAAAVPSIPSWPEFDITADVGKERVALATLARGLGEVRRLPPRRVTSSFCGLPKYKGSSTGWKWSSRPSFTGKSNHR